MSAVGWPQATTELSGVVGSLLCSAHVPLVVHVGAHGGIPHRESNVGWGRAPDSPCNKARETSGYVPLPRDRQGH